MIQCASLLIRPPKETLSSIVEMTDAYLGGDTVPRAKVMEVHRVVSKGVDLCPHVASPSGDMISGKSPNSFDFNFNISKVGMMIEY
jgi:hypothetical protein